MGDGRKRFVRNAKDKQVGERFSLGRAFSCAACGIAPVSYTHLLEPTGPAGVREMAGNATAVLVCWEEERSTSIRRALCEAMRGRTLGPEGARVLVVVGPEGGLCETEVKAICGENRFASTVSLGASILRTETAGLIAPALVLYELGGLQ